MLEDRTSQAIPNYMRQHLAGSEPNKCAAAQPRHTAYDIPFSRKGLSGPIPCVKGIPRLREFVAVGCLDRAAPCMFTKLIWPKGQPGRGASWVPVFWECRSFWMLRCPGRFRRSWMADVLKKNRRVDQGRPAVRTEDERLLAFVPPAEHHSAARESRKGIGAHTGAPTTFLRVTQPTPATGWRDYS